jgi:hypothetical protein
VHVITIDDMPKIRCRTLKLTVLAVATWPLLVYMGNASTASDRGFEAQQSRSQTGNSSGASGQTSRLDYSNFSHSTPRHKQQPCDSCHKFPSANWKNVREGSDAFPDVTDYPGHGSCIGCHRQQFFTGAKPAICTVCHTNPGPRNSERHPFPNPSEVFYASERGQAAVSEFEVYFPHETHQGVVGEHRPYFKEGGIARLVPASFQQADQAEGNKSCSICHQTYQPQGESDEEYVTKPPENLSDDAFWLKKGTFKANPASHAACFTCHSEDGLDPASSNCGGCHKPAPTSGQLTLAESDFDPAIATRMKITDRRTLEKWRKRQSSRYQHEWVTHVDLDCSSCHKVAAINTVDGKGPVVPALSCGGGGTGCHITATASEGGVLNTEVDQKKANPAFECTKCHIKLGKSPAPESHINAISATKSGQ